MRSPPTPGRLPRPGVASSGEVTRFDAVPACLLRPGPPRAYARGVTVSELAAQHGVPLEDLVRTPLIGSLPPLACERGDAVATLDGPAAGETYSLPAARGARVVASDRVRFLRR
jgi:hypothetical protein